MIQEEAAQEQRLAGLLNEQRGMDHFEPQELEDLDLGMQGLVQKSMKNYKQLFPPLTNAKDSKPQLWAAGTQVACGRDEGCS